jgi:hypothetical protein
MLLSVLKTRQEEDVVVNASWKQEPLPGPLTVHAYPITIKGISVTYLPLAQKIIRHFAERIM